MRKHGVRSQNHYASLPWKCLHTRVAGRNVPDHSQSCAAPEAPGSSRPSSAAHWAQNRWHSSFLPLTPFLKTLLSTAAPMEWEAAHTTKVIYACYIGRNTTFSGSCSAQFAIIFLILLISLFYNTFLTILTYIRIWLAVFIVTFKFTHSSNDFQLFGVRWIIRFRVLKKKKKPLGKQN